MSTSAIEIKPLVIDVSVTESALRATLADGREVSVPLAWFPSPAACVCRAAWQLAADRRGRRYPLAGCRRGYLSGKSAGNALASLALPPNPRMQPIGRTGAGFCSGGAFRERAVERTLVRAPI